MKVFKARSAIQISLAAALCFACAEVVLTRHAMAGSTAVGSSESGGSGVSNTFIPNLTIGQPTDKILASRIYNGLNNSLRGLQQRQSVSRPGQRALPISAEKLATIQSAFSNPNSESALSALNQQLAQEIGSSLVSASTSSNSTNDLATAIAASNAFVRGLTPAQLEAVYASPTFMAIWQLLNDANESIGNRRLDDAFTENSSFSLIQLKPVTSTSVPVQPTPTLPPTPPSDNQPPTPPPAFQTPVQGLW
jgi:hypothetical protein